MRRRSEVPLLLLAAAGLWLAWPAAAGTISGVMVDPSPACVDEEVAATVAGTGKCMEIVIQWSAAAGDTTTIPADFDAGAVTATHTYDTAGEYDVTVSPGVALGCTGSADVKLTVERCGLTIDPSIESDVLAGLLEELRKPRIDFAFGIIEPEGTLVVGGSQFGLATGKVWIEGAFGKRQLTVTEHEGSDEWHNGGIGAQMPPVGELLGMDGPDDLDFEIWVETAAGKESNRWPLSFRTEVQEVPSDSVQVLVCGDDGNLNQCNDVEDDGDFCFFPELLSSGWPGGSAAAQHYNCLAAIGDDTDTDIYRVRLKNGWALSSFEFWDSLPYDIGHADPPSGFEEGATSWSPHVGWTVTPGDELGYSLQIYIVGPRGIPHE